MKKIVKLLSAILGAALLMGGIFFLPSMYGEFAGNQAASISYTVSLVGMSATLLFWSAVSENYRWKKAIVMALAAVGLLFCGLGFLSLYRHGNKGVQENHVEPGSARSLPALDKRLEISDMRVSVGFPSAGFNGHGLEVTPDNFEWPEMRLLGKAQVFTPLTPGLAPTEYMSAGIRVFAPPMIHSVEEFDEWFDALWYTDVGKDHKTQMDIGSNRFAVIAGPNRNVWFGYAFLQDRLVQIWFGDPAGILGPERDEQWFRAILASATLDTIHTVPPEFSGPATVDVKQIMGNIVQLGATPRDGMKLHLVEWVNDKEASDMSNGFFIRDLKREERFNVSSEVKVFMMARTKFDDGFAADMRGNIYIREVAYVEFVDAFKKYSSLALVPFWFNVKDGVNTAIQEQYVP